MRYKVFSFLYFINKIPQLKNTSTIFFSSEYFKQMSEEIKENSFLFACLISSQIREIEYMQLEIEKQFNLKVIMNDKPKIKNLFSQLIGNFFIKR